MRGKTVALSEFSKSKSLIEQREFLPIFMCREELLQVIRDHQGVCVCVCVFICCYLVGLLFVVVIIVVCYCYCYLVLLFIVMIY